MNVNKGEEPAAGAGPPDHPSPRDYNHPCPWELELPPLSLPAMLAQTARRVPDAPLVEFLGRRFSYAEIHREALAFAAGLQRMGCRKGERIGLYLPNVPIYASAYYGALIAGATAVNFSPLYTEEELNHQVLDSGATMLVTLDVPMLLPMACKVLEDSPIERLVVGRLADMLPWHKGWALRLFGGKQLTPLPKREGILAWRDALGPGDPAPVEIDPERDLALLQYTGGTTGTPKGAMLTHQNLTANARQVDAVDPFREGDDTIMGVLPLFHVFANTAVLNRSVVKGACVSMLPRFEARQALATMERVAAQAFPGVPTMFQALLDDPRAATTDFSALRVCISGGAPMPQPLHEKFEALSGSRICEGYGLTESSGVVSTNPYLGENRHGTIGQALPETRVRLLDKEDPARDAPPGEPGELAIHGPQIMRGYWNRPDTDAHAFVTRDGRRWLRTGDIATIDDQGYIRIVDRIKDMINVGGFKVFPSQVEDVLLGNPAIKEALVIGVPDDYLGERPAAFVTLNPGDARPTGDELAEWAAAHLGKHERLATLTVRDSLPKTIIGKLDRKALRMEVLGP